jgi:hypothetical protein
VRRKEWMENYLPAEAVGMAAALIALRSRIRCSGRKEFVIVGITRVGCLACKSRRVNTSGHGMAVGASSSSGVGIKGMTACGMTNRSRSLNVAVLVM